MAPRKTSKKRTAAAVASSQDAVAPSQEAFPAGAVKGAAGRKRAKISNDPKPEPEYQIERRNMEDLWQAAFPVGTEWENMEKLKEIKWDFSNLENAFEEGGVLHGKTVYMFGSTEAQLLVVNGEQKVVLIPIVVAIDSPVPPSDKIGVKSVQRETEDILPMKAMKMAWIPYVPLEDRQSQMERYKPKIFTIGCNQRRSALKHLKIERVKQYDYCLPYLQPLVADEYDNETTVDIMYPLEPPIVCEFDWELDDLEDFTEEWIKGEDPPSDQNEELTKGGDLPSDQNGEVTKGGEPPSDQNEELTKGGVLPRDQKEAFKEYVKEQVRSRKKAQREVKEALKKAIEDMDPKIRAARENMKVYKFYPVQTPDTPDISQVQVAYINRYYGKAHQVL